MKDFWNGMRAVAGLTILEALRQRLWLLLVIGCGALLVGVPNLQAVDDGSRVRLAVATITAVIGFIAVLLGILVVSGTVRRDIEQKTGYLLFSKPCGRLAYLAGRWCGTVGALAVAVLLLGLVGSFALWWQQGRLPSVRGTVLPASWERIDALGGRAPVRADEEGLLLPHQIGAGLRLGFRGLDTGSDQEVLLRARVRGDGVGSALSQAPIVLRAESSNGPMRLELAEDSPYGHRLRGEVVAEGQVALRHRDAERDGLDTDYARVILPAAAIAADGSAVIELRRVESLAGIGFRRSSDIRVAQPAGTFVGNQFRAGLITLAQAGLLAAAALYLASIASVGTALLGCLTIYFAGNAVGIVSETLAWGSLPMALDRLLRLIISLMPDFSAFATGPALAAGEVVSWSSVAGSWLYFGIFTLAFGVAAAVSFARREL